MKDSDNSGYETNLGWWTEKPDRKPGVEARRKGPDHFAERPLGLQIWRNCVLVVLVAVALVWTLKVAAGW